MVLDKVTDNDEGLTQELADLISEFGFPQLDHLKNAAAGPRVPQASATLRDLPRAQLEAGAALVLRYLVQTRGLDMAKVALLTRGLELMEVEVFEGMAGFGPPAQA